MDTIFRIKELRNKCGITQAQLAANLGLRSSSTIAMWENGERKPPSTILPRLADVFGCTIDELFGRGQARAGREKAPPERETTHENGGQQDGV